jgi:RNAse (barnase) inhibitor barstar
MIKNDRCFDYIENINTIVNDENFIAEVPKGISNVDDLFSALFDILNLPGYFGFNWNALYDCLCDFHWIDQHTVIIIHEDIPALSHKDLYLYLEVLQDAVNDWKPGESHKLTVVFPKSYQDAVENIKKKKVYR